MGYYHLIAIVSFVVAIANPLWQFVLKTCAFVHCVYERISSVVCFLYRKFVEDVASSVSDKIHSRIENIIDEKLKNIEQKQQKIGEEKPPLNPTTNEDGTSPNR